MKPSTSSMRTVLSLALLIAIVLPHGAAFVIPHRAFAADLIVTPAIIDHAAFPRDIFNETITVKNLTGRKTSFYPVVQNIETTDGRQKFLPPSSADLSSSLANWISISRSGIELEPGEERTIDMKLQVNLKAKPGIYHAAIAFPRGSTRAQAEGSIQSASTVLVNIEVQDDAQEILHLSKFAPVSSMFFTGPASFTYTLENTGNRVVTPDGEIIVYDRTGREIGSVPVNPGATTVSPDTEHRFYATWKNEGFGFGRYKAYLALEYGASDERMQDTIYFWIIPWYAALLIIGISGSIMFVVATMIHARYARWHGEHLTQISKDHKAALRTALLEQHAVLASTSKPIAVPPPPPRERRPITRTVAVPLETISPSQLPVPQPYPPTLLARATHTALPPPPPHPTPPQPSLTTPPPQYRSAPVASAPVPMHTPVLAAVRHAPIRNPLTETVVRMPDTHPRMIDLVPDTSSPPQRYARRTSTPPTRPPVARIVSDLRPHTRTIRES